MATRRPTTTTTRRPQVRDDGEDDDDLHSLVSEQRNELMAAETLESDLDLAFKLQLQEAVAASLAHQPSSSAPLEPQNDTVCHSVGFATVQSEELVRLQQELKDRQQSEIEMRKMREDLCRRIHDQNFAREILRIPEEDWRDWGDNFEKPFCGEGSSSSSGGSTAIGNECEYRLYFKGLISDEKVGDQRIKLAGIGVAICDSRDNLIFEVRKPLIVNGMNKIGAEAKALIEGLNAALVLELKRLVFYCDYYPIFQFVSFLCSQNISSSFFYKFIFLILTELVDFPRIESLDFVLFWVFNNFFVNLGCCLDCN